MLHFLNSLAPVPMIQRFAAKLKSGISIQFKNFLWNKSLKWQASPNSDSLRINNYWVCKSGQKLGSPVLGVYCHMTANRLSKHCPRTKLLSSVNIFNPKLWDVSFTKQTSQSPVSDVKVKVLFAFDRFKTNWNNLKLEMLLCSKTVFLGKITFTDTVALSTKKSGQL